MEGAKILPLPWPECLFGGKQEEKLERALELFLPSWHSRALNGEGSVDVRQQKGTETPCPHCPQAGQPRESSPGGREVFSGAGKAEDPPVALPEDLPDFSQR